MPARMNSRLIVILNDNDMSIAPPVGAMSAYLARLISGRTYRSLREIGKQLAQHLPKFFEERAAARRGICPRLRDRRHAVRGDSASIYVGPIDGHNLDHLLPVLQQRARRQERARSWSTS